MNTILLESNVMEKDGIFVAKEIADKTVWDTLAQENPMHAVISANDEEAVKKKSAPQIEHIKQFVNDDTVLLDLGCGYGRVAKYLLPTKKLKRYLGVDSSYEMLQLFKKRYANSVAEQSTPVTLVNADIHTLPVESKSVDAVVVCAVFLHNHKTVVKSAIEELKRVMKPQATLLVYSSFPRSYSLMGLQGNLYQGLLNLMGKPMKNGPVRYYSKREIADLLSDFSTVEYVSDGFAILPKTIIILPGVLENIYRVGIANPVNSLLEKICPKVVKGYFASFLDVIATR